LIIVPTPVFLIQTLRAIGRDYDVEEDGSISVDGGLCSILCPEGPGLPVVIRFTAEADPIYAGDLTLRLAWFLQVLGILVEVDSGLAVVSKGVGFIQ
jgi:hypothetical protein